MPSAGMSVPWALALGVPVLTAGERELLLWRQHKAVPADDREIGDADQEVDHRVIVYSTMPTGDGFAGDQTLLAPPFTSPDADLGEMVARVATTVQAVARSVEGELR